MGLKLRIRTDEIGDRGGVDVAAGGIYQRRTLDGDYGEGIQKLAAAKVIGNLLPSILQPHGRYLTTGS